MSFSTDFFYADRAIFHEGFSVDTNPSATVSFGGATVNNIGVPVEGSDAVRLDFLQQTT